MKECFVYEKIGKHKQKKEAKYNLQVGSTPPRIVCTPHGEFTSKWVKTEEGTVGKFRSLFYRKESGLILIITGSISKNNYLVYFLIENCYYTWSVINYMFLYELLCC